MKIECHELFCSFFRYTDAFSNQIDSMQADINSLKELMQNEGLTLDVNTLLDVSMHFNGAYFRFSISCIIVA